MRRVLYLVLVFIFAIVGIVAFKARFLRTSANAEEINIVAYYPAVGKIVGFCNNTDTVFVKTNDGNMWFFTGIEDWMEGDGISVIMCDNGTETVTDDYMVGNPRYWNPDVLEGVKRNYGKLD